jgi:hypothetical protein
LAGTHESLSRLRRLLWTDNLAKVADARGRALLWDLPTKRNPARRDGPLTAISRFIAKGRARRVWR